MRIYRAKDYQDLSRKAANIISAQVILKPDCVLGLATGSSPIGTYKQLIEWYNKGDLDFSEVKTVNLDEYRGLGIESDQSYVYFMQENLFKHINIKSENIKGDLDFSEVKTVNLDEYRGLGIESDQSYVYFMQENLFKHINIKSENINIPNGKNTDADAECKRYEKVIADLGGTDIQLLGIGRNGHIGFNEPDTSFIKETHCVDLTQSTIDANKRFFASIDDVPRQAYTMGINAIMQAKKVLLIASGKDKAEAIYKSFFGPITPEVPASILQLHKDVVVVADDDALSLVK